MMEQAKQAPKTLRSCKVFIKIGYEPTRFQTYADYQWVTTIGNIIGNIFLCCDNMSATKMEQSRTRRQAHDIFCFFSPSSMASRPSPRTPRSHEDGFSELVIFSGAWTRLHHAGSFVMMEGKPHAHARTRAWGTMGEVTKVRTDAHANAQRPQGGGGIDHRAKL